MSYEGYVQTICANGHYDTFPETYGEGYPLCSHCGALPAWTNPVDNTNCDSVGVIPPHQLEKFVVSRTVAVCNLGHDHGEVLYRIPSETETEEARHWYDGSNFLPMVTSKF